MKKVSVIIPVYNVEDYIEPCLASVLNQSHRDIECILIDDCSTDRSVEIAERFIQNHPKKDRVKWIRQQQNQGQSVARNRGVEVASGEYIFFVDSDDTISENCLITHLQYLEKSHAEVTIGSIKEVGENGNLNVIPLKEKILDRQEIWASFLNFQWYFTPWNKLIKRDFFIQNRLWFEKGIIYEDHLWNFRLALAANRICLFSEVTYFYLLRPGSSIRNRATKFNFDSWETVLVRMKQTCTERQLQQHDAVIKFFEYSKFNKMDSLISDPLSWKMFRPLLKIKMAPTWKLLLGLYGSKLRNRAFLSLLPYFLYKPLYKIYCRCGRTASNL